VLHWGCVCVRATRQRVGQSSMDDHITTTTTTTTSAADDAVKQAVKRRRDSDSLTDSEVPALFSLRASNIKYHHYYTDDMKRSA